MQVVDSINETHDPKLESWVESANQPDCDFPIQNLPLGVFESARGPCVGIAIGDQILDIGGCYRAGLVAGPAAEAAEKSQGPVLNPLMALNPVVWSALRRRLSELLRKGSPDRHKIARAFLVPMDQTRMRLPVEIGDFTDFYASVHHATNVGRLFRPENPLLPNYKYVPVAYHGRASSVVVSGTAIRRPRGQIQNQSDQAPSFRPSDRLDYEAEVGFFVGPGNSLGRPIGIEEVKNHIFGLCLVNDWSARDIQRWEYQPLGPFLSKSFATTISPWVLTMEALAPFRVPAFRRPDSDPAPLPYLDSPEDAEQGGIDLTVEVLLASAQMRDRGLGFMSVSQGNLRELYWTPAQMIAHHSSNGCNLRTGDLLATGTVSGDARESQGCLLELTQGGMVAIKLPGGELRRFLQDGDEVVIRGYCRREGFARIGCGECRGRVLPAIQ
jgi:fumarylacetoacetase